MKRDDGRLNKTKETQKTVHEENVKKHVERNSLVYMWRELDSAVGKYWRRIGPMFKKEVDMDNRKARGYKLWDELTEKEKEKVNIDNEGKKVFEV